MDADDPPLDRATALLELCGIAALGAWGWAIPQTARMLVGTALLLGCSGLPAVAGNDGGIDEAARIARVAPLPG